MKRGKGKQSGQTVGCEKCLPVTTSWEEDFVKKYGKLLKTMDSHFQGEQKIGLYEDLKAFINSVRQQAYDTGWTDGHGEAQDRYVDFTEKALSEYKSKLEVAIEGAKITRKPTTASELGCEGCGFADKVCFCKRNQALDEVLSIIKHEENG